MTTRLMGRLALAFVATACLAAGAAPAARQLAMEPLKDAGQNVYPAFEGWYQNSDGTYTLLIGYYNRNKKQTLDIPIGPENRIEPGGPDQGQPTHFVVGRGWGTISIKVPKDFGDKKINWTLTANGKTVTIPFGITKGYQIEPFKDMAMGNMPPVIKLTDGGPALTGPPGPLSTYPTINGVAGEPVTIAFTITDDGHEETPTGGGAAAPPPPPAPGTPSTTAAPAAGGGFPRRERLSGTLSKYRGPGTVAFADATPTIEKNKASTTATFSLPGEYVIRIEGNDSSGVGGGGFQCCWTTAYVKVNVKPGSTSGK